MSRPAKRARSFLTLRGASRRVPIESKIRETVSRSPRQRTQRSETLARLSSALHESKTLQARPCQWIANLDTGKFDAPDPSAQYGSEYLRVLHPEHNAIQCFDLRQLFDPNYKRFLEELSKVPQNMTVAQISYLKLLQRQLENTRYEALTRAEQRTIESIRKLCTKKLDQAHQFFETARRRIPETTQRRLDSLERALERRTMYRVRFPEHPTYEESLDVQLLGDTASITQIPLEEIAQPFDTTQRPLLPGTLPLWAFFLIQGYIKSEDATGNLEADARRGIQITTPYGEKVSMDEFLRILGDAYDREYITDIDLALIELIMQLKNPAFEVPDSHPLEQFFSQDVKREFNRYKALSRAVNTWATEMLQPGQSTEMMRGIEEQLNRAVLERDNQRYKLRCIILYYLNPKHKIWPNREYIDQNCIKSGGES